MILNFIKTRISYYKLGKMICKNLTKLSDFQTKGDVFLRKQTFRYTQFIKPVHTIDISDGDKWLEISQRED